MECYMLFYISFRYLLYIRPTSCVWSEGHMSAGVLNISISPEFIRGLFLRKLSTSHFPKFGEDVFHIKTCSFFFSLKTRSFIMNHRVGFTITRRYYLLELNSGDPLSPKAIISSFDRN